MVCSLRRTHFGPAAGNRRTCEYCSLGETGAYFATTLAVFSELIITNFRERIVKCAIDHLGPCKLTRAELLLFTSGCGIESIASSSDEQRGLKFFLSLSPREKRFKGGEIILFGPQARIGN